MINEENFPRLTIVDRLELLEDTQQTLADLVIKYGPDAYLDIESDYDYHLVYVCTKRLESDKAYMARFAEHKERLKRKAEAAHKRAETARVQALKARAELDSLK